MTNRAWQRMLSGRRLNLLDPSPMDIEIEDIAHGLAYVARWNGQTFGERPYSVAAHSLLVEEIFTIRNPHIGASWQMAALLHDGAEYVLGDMISPVKALIGSEYEKLEAKVQAAIHLRFRLPQTLAKPMKREIKAADLSAAYLEARQFAGFEGDELLENFTPPKERDILQKTIPLERAHHIKSRFLARFSALEKKREAEE